MEIHVVDANSVPVRAESLVGDPIPRKIIRSRLYLLLEKAEERGERVIYLDADILMPVPEGDGEDELNKEQFLALFECIRAIRDFENVYVRGIHEQNKVKKIVIFSERKNLESALSIMFPNIG